MKVLVKPNANKISTGESSAWSESMNQFLGDIIEVEKTTRYGERYHYRIPCGNAFHKDWVESVYKRAKKEHSSTLRIVLRANKLEAVALDREVYEVKCSNGILSRVHSDYIEDWVEGETWNGSEWVNLTPMKGEAMKPIVPVSNIQLPNNLLILIRNGIIYRRSRHSQTVFSSLFESDITVNVYSFNDIKENDKLYAFDRNEQIAETLNVRGCLDKFLVRKPNNEVDFDTLYNIVKSGKYVGATRVGGLPSRSKKVLIRLRSAEDRKNIDAEMEAIHTGGEVSDGIFRKIDVWKTEFVDLVYTDNLVEFCKWFMAQTPPG